MAGNGPSAEQLRKELRKTLTLFVRHHATSSATNDDRNQAEAPAPPPFAPLRCSLQPEGLKIVASKESFSFNLSDESHGLSLSRSASSSTGLPASSVAGFSAGSGAGLLASSGAGFSAGSGAGLAAARAVASRHEKGLFSYEVGYATRELQDEQDETFDTVARQLDVIATAVNERYGCRNSQGGESQTKSSFLSAVSGLVSGAATTFRVAVAQCVHSELPEVHQLALLFHVAATAMQQVGSDVYKAQRITDITVDYAYDKYGDYIAANGGLGNAVKHS